MFEIKIRSFGNEEIFFKYVSMFSSDEYSVSVSDINFILPLTLFKDTCIQASSHVTGFCNHRS